MIGMVEVGNVIAHPFGWDLEDFPVARICETTAIKSRDCATVPRMADISAKKMKSELGPMEA